MASVKLYSDAVGNYQIQRSNDFGATWVDVYSGSNPEFTEDLVVGEYLYRMKATGADEWSEVKQINIGVKNNPNMDVVDLLSGQTITENTYTSYNNTMGASTAWRTYNSVDVSEFSGESYLLCFYAGIFNGTISNDIVPIVGVYEDNNTVKILELKTPNSNIFDYYYVTIPKGIKLLSFSSRRRLSMTATAFFDNNKPEIKDFSGNVSTVNLPINGMGTSIANNVNSHQSNIFVTDNSDVYIALIGSDTYLKVLKKPSGSAIWETYDFNGKSVNPFGTTARDAHMNYSIMVTKNGFIIISGNMHNHPCKAVISTNANDINSWSSIDYTGGHSQVTYPTFVQNSLKETFAIWRNGGSSSGEIFIAKFNDNTNVFGTRTKIISDTGVGAYKNKVIIDNNDRFHISWCFRNESASGETTSGIWYMYSDNGVSWKKSDETEIALPANRTNTERIYEAIEGSGIINQNSSCVDNDGVYHTVFWQRDNNGRTQIIHTWLYDGVWSSERLTHLIHNEDLSAGSLTGRLLRPQIAYFSQIKKTLAFFNTWENDSKNKITFVDVETKEIFRHNLTIGSSELQGFFKDGKHHLLHGNLSTSNAPEFASVEMYYTVIG